MVDFLSVRPIHIDPLLQNEDDVGNAIQKSDVPRSDIWLTSKVCFGNVSWPCFFPKLRMHPALE